MMIEYAQRKTYKNDSSKKLIALCMIICALVLLGTNNPLFTAVGFIACTLICLKSSLAFSFSLLLFLLPMATIFKFAPGQFSAFTIVQLIWVICAFFKTGMKATKADIGIILFFIYLSICQIFYGGFDISATIKLSFGLLMLLMVKKMRIYDNYVSIFLAYIFGVIVSSLFMYIDSPLFNILAYVSSKTERLAGSEAGSYITRFAGLYGDPNYYSVNLIIAMILSLCLFKMRKVTLIQVIYLIAPLAFFAAQTGSKSAFFMLIIPILLFEYISIKNRHYFLACISIGLIGFGGWMLFQGEFNAFSVAIQRLTANHSNLNDITTGRGAKWVECLEYILDRPIIFLFGNSLLVVTLNGLAPHNTYIDMLFQLGVIGTVWMLWIFVKAWKHCAFKRSVLNYSLIIVISIMYFFLSELQYFDFLFHISLCLIVGNLNFSEKNRGVELNEHKEFYT